MQIRPVSIMIQSHHINMDTEGAVESVHINELNLEEM